LTTVSAGAHRGLEDEEVGFGDLERVESSLETVTAAAAIQFREDETVNWTSYSIDQLDRPSRVWISGDDVSCEDVGDVIVAVLSFQSER
jgi:hypothetical protein